MNLEPLNVYRYVPRLVRRLTKQIGWAALQTVLLLYTYILGELHTCKRVRIELNYYTRRSGRRASRSAFMLRRWLLQLPAMMTLHLVVSGPLRLEDSKATQCYFRMIWCVACYYFALRLVQVAAYIAKP